MHKLSSEEIEILGILLDHTPENGGGVDSLSFRANYFNAVTLIDRLEAEGYIRLDQDHYFVSLTALVQMDNKRAIDILKNAELLFIALKDHYLRTQRDHLNVDTLAEQIGIKQAIARETLSYMVEGTWWGGRSTNFFGDTDTFIQPSETILKFNSFAEVVQQLRGWQATRIKDRRLALAAALRAHTNEQNMPTQLALNISRQKPDWFMLIPESPRDLLEEVYSALTLNLRALPAMGVRAVIDVVCTNLVGDSGTFEAKVNRLLSNGHITDMDRSILSMAFDAGSASAHRGYVPNREDVTTLLDVVEHLLRAQYVLLEAAKKMQANTPVRSTKKN